MKRTVAVRTAAPASKKRRRRPAPVVPSEAARTHEDARRQLRAFFRFIKAQDPIALAALVTDVEGTLGSCTTIEHFFKTYVLALRSRRPQ